MQSQKIVLSQEQKLKLSPQLFQSIQLMALPLVELEQRIRDEVEKNPALEVSREKGEVSMADMEAGPAQERAAQDYDPFENSSDPGYEPSLTSYTDSGEDTKRQFLEGAVSRGQTLQEHMEEQLNLMKGFSEQEYELGFRLIHNLDENGFHRESPMVLAEGDEVLLDRVLPRMQHLDPPGCCTSDVMESLQVQAGQRSDSPADIITFLQEIVPRMRDDKHEALLKASGLTEEEFQEHLDFIRTLTPFPGRLYSSDNLSYIIPDLQVKKDGDELVIFLNDSPIPELRVNSYFEELDGIKGQEKEVRRFVGSHVKDARWFINSLEQRNRTLLRAAKAIVEHQREFFHKGVKALVPLTLKDIAGEIDVHEATVSRITTNKYVQTEWGIFELKFFFTNSISGTGSSGSTYSREAVKEIIREIIEANGEAKRLSDQKISDILAERGINIARRTAAKYRKELDIDSSYRR
ncbi:MAG: RNA polymerase factor sigma-54 [Spirochaetales bacterium]|nr:RNA polymerase factor sigma-54 [Spirochaetales bacterium]